MSENTLVENAVANAESKAKVKPLSLGQFNGAFKRFADTWFNDLRFYGIDPYAAHKVCNDGMSKLGDAMSKDATLGAQVSKANKDGNYRFAISGKSDYVKGSNALTLIRISQQLEKLRVEKLLCAPLNITDLRKFIHEDVNNYLKESQDWADAQEWAE